MWRRVCLLFTVWCLCVGVCGCVAYVCVCLQVGRDGRPQPPSPSPGSDLTHSASAGALRTACPIPRYPRWSWPPPPPHVHTATSGAALHSNTRSLPSGSLTLLYELFIRGRTTTAQRGFFRNCKRQFLSYLSVCLYVYVRVSQLCSIVYQWR